MKLGPGSYGEDKSRFLNTLGSEACKRKKAKPKLESQAKLASTHARTHAQNRRNKDPGEAATQRGNGEEPQERRKRKKDGNEEDDEDDDEKGSLNVHQVLLFSLFTFAKFFPYSLLYFF
jgi:hypothetical protein